ncbi:unnamed protein product [Paramecium sonneborni]|uniref:Uncharacterized protein n=1 Tax=Paramecium sonneborni TaxID=65129 RepID=A0A8S1PK58_9CILI|nr:unnamed protein product [Paramecium sonneborni]
MFEQLTICQINIPLIDLSQGCGRQLKSQSNTFNEHQINQFLQIANNQEDGQVIRGATSVERVLSVLEGLEANISGSLEALEKNEINVS